MFQILIVEDDKELSQLFQKVLEKNGYQVKSASDGAQALEVLDKEYIDLIISDIMMPVMDGYELVSELRSAGYQILGLLVAGVLVRVVLDGRLAVGLLYFVCVSVPGNAQDLVIIPFLCHGSTLLQQL